MTWISHNYSTSSVQCAKNCFKISFTSFLNPFFDFKNFFRRLFVDFFLSKRTLTSARFDFSFLIVFFEKHFTHSCFPRQMFHMISSTVQKADVSKDSVNNKPLSKVCLNVEMFLSMQNWAIFNNLREKSIMGDHHWTALESTLGDFSILGTNWLSSENTALTEQIF